jgi:hypothetical protein
MMCDRWECVDCGTGRQWGGAVSNPMARIVQPLLKCTKCNTTTRHKWTGTMIVSWRDHYTLKIKEIGEGNRPDPGIR